ncbi:hypothetical protein BJ741DRAFT_41831 [Chytriomyces cf. hyalinus JEL632]|nr:hypothetical protein BJ741DRAFT_41831 [Chytriomyces cf. hyalinus JEL632]
MGMKWLDTARLCSLQHALNKQPTYFGHNCTMFPVPSCACRPFVSVNKNESCFFFNWEMFVRASRLATRPPGPSASSLRRATGPIHAQTILPSLATRTATPIIRTASTATFSIPAVSQFAAFATPSPDATFSSSNDAGSNSSSNSNYSSTPSAAAFSVTGSTPVSAAMLWGNLPGKLADSIAKESVLLTGSDVFSCLVDDL